jgi:hypothetical protein
MKRDITKVDSENYIDVIQELEDAYYDIPFENSDFQNEMFVIASQITPERAYRAIGLRMFSKLQALNDAKFGRELEDIEIAEIEETLESPTLGKWERKKLDVELRKKLSNRRYTDKLINDALRELNVLYKHFKLLPKFTREQFEGGERRHFEQRLVRQLSGVGDGPRGSLLHMNEDYAALVEFEHDLQLTLEEGSDQEISRLLENMSNFVVPTPQK